MQKLCQYCGKAFDLKAPAQRYCSDECFRSGRREACRRWHKKNAAYTRAYYKEHREKILAYNREYSKTHREEISQRKREWYRRRKAERDLDTQ